MGGGLYAKRMWRAGAQTPFGLEQSYGSKAHMASFLHWWIFVGLLGSSSLNSFEEFLDSESLQLWELDLA